MHPGLMDAHRQNGRVRLTVYIARSLGEDEIEVFVIWPEGTL